MVKNSLAGDASSIPGPGRSPGGENGNTSSILVWRIPRTQEPGGLQPMGLQRAPRDWEGTHMSTGYTKINKIKYLPLRNLPSVRREMDG